MFLVKHSFNISTKIAKRIRSIKNMATRGHSLSLSGKFKKNLLKNHSSEFKTILQNGHWVTFKKSYREFGLLKNVAARGRGQFPYVLI